MAWQPTIVKRVIRSLPTSARTAIVETDIGPAYLKAIGGPEGEHTLAAELVGTRLAHWFGLSTFDFAIVDVGDIPEIRFIDREGNVAGKATPGPAFITRAELRDVWSGESKQLGRLVNPGDVGRLVVFDTWTLNCDRFSWNAVDPLRPPRVNRNNVFLSQEAPAGRFRLKAIDHTHCFTCGREWTANQSGIDNVQDMRVFGLFPEFRTLIDGDRNSVRQGADRLRHVRQDDVARMVGDLPAQWHVSGKARDALVSLVVARASHVANTIEQGIWPQKSFPFEDQANAEPEP